MELPQNKIENNDELIRVKIYMFLMTPDSSEFTNVDDEYIKNSAKNNPETLVSALQVEFKNIQSHHPLGDIQNMVKEEMQESILNNMNLAKIISSLTPADIISVTPRTKPKTEPIQVAEYIITPDEYGLIGLVDFESFEEHLCR